jgi:hypothetical protein
VPWKGKSSLQNASNLIQWLGSILTAKSIDDLFETDGLVLTPRRYRRVNQSQSGVVPGRF